MLYLSVIPIYTTTTPAPTRPPKDKLSLDYYVAKWDEKPSGSVFTCNRHQEGSLLCNSAVYSVDDINIYTESGEHGVFDGINTINWSDGKIWMKECKVYEIRISAEYYEQSLLSDYTYR